LKPNQWVSLHDGDKLQCGKIAFTVSVNLSEQELASPGTAKSVATKHRSAASIVKGEAWKDFDIVAFLEAEDEAERNAPYGSLPIRKHDPDHESDEHACVSEKKRSRSVEVTSLNLLDGDEEAQAILKEARRNASEKANAEELHAAFRARRIAAIRANLEAKRRNTDRDMAINNQLRLMLSRGSSA
jgi:hypothetical protein